VRSRLAPVKQVAATIRRHLWGILNAVILGVHNGYAESMNSRIQRLKHRANGYRNRERFRNAIYFHLGGLDLYPTQAGLGQSTHSIG
jgi:transposase